MSKELVDLLFPHLSGENEYFAAAEIDGALSVLTHDLKAMLRSRSGKMPREVDEVCDAFFAELPAIYRTLWLDAEALHFGDPASESIDEVISAYPGFFAIYVHRVAHALHELGVTILPRILAEYAHLRTGIDIHPGATIGERLCIDHGTGVVIGETAVIGKGVKIYQGVSLGALSVSKEMAGTRRHPTVEDNVVIYSNAVILGGGHRGGARQRYRRQRLVDRERPPLFHRLSQERVHPAQQTGAGRPDRFQHMRGRP